MERPSKVMEAMRADNYWRAVEEVVPTAVSNGMKAWRPEDLEGEGHQ